jgi:hypothetical protein
MTAALNALLDANAFVPSPLVDDLIACHVPFDELVKGAAVESAVEERARRGVAVALVGASGSGKSAVTAFALARVSTDFAPIRVPVFYETEQTIKDPGTFARYFLQRLANDAEAATSLDPEERERLLRQASERLTLPARTIGHSLSAGVQLPWLLKGDAARNVWSTLSGADIRGSTDAALDAIDRVIQVIEAGGLTPIIVIDDTDRWLRVGEVDRRDLVGSFFGTIVRMLAERGCGLVVAVHETYLAMEEYRVGTRGFLTDTIRVPLLRSAEAVAAILQHRVSIQLGDVALAHVAEPGVPARLFGYYETNWGHSIRWTLQAAHEALTEAVAANAHAITEAMVDDAAAAYSRQP